MPKATTERSIRQAGEYFERWAIKHAKALSADLDIVAVETTGDVRFQGEWFEIDVLLFVRSVGIVVLETKAWKDTIWVRDEGPWTRDRPNRVYEDINACEQVMRAGALLKEMLSDHNLLNWPVHVGVWITLPGARIKGKSRCPIICPRGGLESWIRQLPRTRKQIDERDATEVVQVIRSYEREYERPKETSEYVRKRGLGIYNTFRKFRLPKRERIFWEFFNWVTSFWALVAALKIFVFLLEPGASTSRIAMDGLLWLGVPLGFLQVLGYGRRAIAPVDRTGWFAFSIVTNILPNFAVMFLPLGMAFVLITSFGHVGLAIGVWLLVSYVVWCSTITVWASKHS